MSMPTVPNITPTITLNTEQAFNLLLASIALEELSLSHIMNAEAEKIQFILGTLPGQPQTGSFNEIMAVNKDVRMTLNTIIRKEILIQMKLDTILETFAPVLPTPLLQSGK